MAQVRCYCGAHTGDPETTTYVKEGKPLCHEITCERVKRRMDMELRRTPFADDIEHDNVPEPYSKSAHARFTDI